MHREKPPDCRHADRAEQRGSSHSSQGDLWYAPPRPFPPPQLFHPGAQRQIVNEFLEDQLHLRSLSCKIILYLNPGILL